MVNNKIQLDWPNYRDHLNNHDRYKTVELRVTRKNNPNGGIALLYHAVSSHTDVTLNRELQLDPKEYVAILKTNHKFLHLIL